MQRAAFDPNWTSAETAEKLAVSALAAKEAADKPTGIPPELLERCLRQKARPKKGADASRSADTLVLVDQEAKKVREQCVRSVIAQHRRKAAAKKAAKKR
jgi:hypothetical protein